MTTFGAVLELSFSGALPRTDGAKRGPALLDVRAVAVRALHLAFFVIHERQNLVEEFLAVTAEEFVVGHSRPPQCRRVTERILDPLVGPIQHGAGREFCVLRVAF